MNLAYDNLLKILSHRERYMDAKTNTCTHPPKKRESYEKDDQNDSV